VNVVWRRAAAYVVCRDNRGGLLLTRFASPSHPDHGKWTLPGGAMEWGESPEATAHRELAEETGLTAMLGPVLGVFSRWYTEDEAVAGVAGHAVGIVYAAADWRGELRADFDDGTTDDAKWFAIDEVRSLPRVELVDFVIGLI
jgi:ADP-ribose pyrophosphatase YjhB (NUDIX family)